jgi:hypothetical protein
MLSCASQAEANVDISLIIEALKGQTPVVIAAKLTAELVTQQVLPQLIGNDDKLAERLGFTDSDHVVLAGGHITLDIPYPVFVVDLNQLQNWNGLLPSSPGIALIALETNWLFDPSLGVHPLPAQYLYPILEDQKVASSVLLALDRTESSQWNTHQIGSSDLIRQIYKVRPPGKATFLLRVPALNRYYLGMIKQEEPATPVTFTITAIFDDPGTGMHRGDTVPALKVFQDLGIEADKINRNDPNYPPR